MKTPWKTRPISRTCEVMTGRNTFCGEPTNYAYPAYGGGWMSLCDAHAQKHLPYCPSTESLIAKGETRADERRSA